jgi:glycosyltransferase involved in cell wall biosynthesis
MEGHAATEENMKRLGITHTVIPCPRNKIALLRDLFYMINVFFWLLKVRPDAVISYTIKPNVYCGIVLRFFKRVRFFPVVTGLGFAFQNRGAKRRVLRRLVVGLHRKAFQVSDNVIFQNNENCDFFVSENIVDEERAVIIQGDGVYIPEASKSFFRKPLSFVCVSRLLGEKGLRELFEASKIVRCRYPDFHISVFGPKETSPDAITDEDLANWSKSGALIWRGYCDDVGELFSRSDIFILPSHHEGMSTAVCEATAHGLPVIATDIPGIREMVDGNGILVPVNSPERLANAIFEMLEMNVEELLEMSRVSRDIAVSGFQREDVMRRVAEVITF